MTPTSRTLTANPVRTAFLAVASITTLTALAVSPALAAGPEKAAMAEKAEMSEMMMKDDMKSDSLMKDSMMKDAMAKDAMVKDAMAETMSSGPLPLVRVNKTLKGSVKVVKSADGSAVIRFSDDFKASNGPDLKVFLNPKRVSDVTGKTATQGAVLLSPLKANTGVQEYTLPAGVNLADFESVLVHCEQFSVLWGGADI